METLRREGRKERRSIRRGKEGIKGTVKEGKDQGKREGRQEGQCTCKLGPFAGHGVILFGRGRRNEFGVVVDPPPKNVNVGAHSNGNGVTTLKDRWKGDEGAKEGWRERRKEIYQGRKEGR
jgi:hypothetical protein